MKPRPECNVCLQKCVLDGKGYKRGLYGLIWDLWCYHLARRKISFALPFRPFDFIMYLARNDSWSDKQRKLEVTIQFQHCVHFVISSIKRQLKKVSKKTIALSTLEKAQGTIHFNHFGWVEIKSFQGISTIESPTAWHFVAMAKNSITSTSRISINLESTM